MTEPTADFYEVLQVSANAEPETINRVYRLLAQRFHPDNRETGDENRFREIHEAHAVLSDPEKRAKYDVLYHQQRQDEGADGGSSRPARALRTTSRWSRSSG